MIWLGRGRMKEGTANTTHIASQASSAPSSVRTGANRDSSISVPCAGEDLRSDLAGHFGEQWIQHRIEPAGARQRNGDVFRDFAWSGAHHDDTVGKQQRFLDRVRDEN